MEDGKGKMEEVGWKICRPNQCNHINQCNQAQREIFRISETPLFLITGEVSPKITLHLSLKIRRND
jgi:hypothetical protein